MTLSSCSATDSIRYCRCASGKWVETGDRLIEDQEFGRWQSQGSKPAGRAGHQKGVRLSGSRGRLVDPAPGHLGIKGRVEPSAEVEVVAHRQRLVGRRLLGDEPDPSELRGRLGRPATENLDRARCGLQEADREV